MIRIRYRDPNEFSPGLHAAAERHDRTTTVYLLSGLTAAERGSALRRLRLSARMGHCPRLPAAQLALALLADQVRTAVGRAGAVFRLHPAGSTVPVMVLCGGVVAFLACSTVSIRVLPTPRTATQSSAVGTSPVAPGAGGSGTNHRSADPPATSALAPASSTPAAAQSRAAAAQSRTAARRPGPPPRSPVPRPRRPRPRRDRGRAARRAPWDRSTLGP